MTDEVEFSKGVRTRKRYAAKWSRDTCARVGFLLGRGETNTAVARHLKMSASTIRSMKAQWKLPCTDPEHPDRAIVPIPLGSNLRYELIKQAEARGVTMDQLIAQILTNIKQDDLWKAMLDD